MKDFLMKDSDCIKKGRTALISRRKTSRLSSTRKSSPNTSKALGVTCESFGVPEASANNRIRAKSGDQTWK